MGGAWGRAARLGFPVARVAAAPVSDRRRLGWLSGAGAGPLLLVAAAVLPRRPVRPPAAPGAAPHFLRAGAGRGSIVGQPLRDGWRRRRRRRRPSRGTADRHARRRSRRQPRRTAGAGGRRVPPPRPQEESQGGSRRPSATCRRGGGHFVRPGPAAG